LKKERYRKMAKIMLVDDAAFMRMMLKNTLTQAGYTDLVEAEDGAKAVEVYSAEKPDLVFMDITMPNKDGLETLKEIKGMDPGATIVMCSAMGQEAMVMDSIKSGAKDFIVKPFKPERILSTVKKILG
jgi:two-component system chemotaxis response regulator CheY